MESQSWDKEPQLRSEEAAGPKVNFYEQTLTVDDLVPESFSSCSRVRIRDLIDRRVGECIGIKRMTYQGLTGFPEVTATHVYIWFIHFF